MKQENGFLYGQSSTCNVKTEYGTIVELPHDNVAVLSLYGLLIRRKKCYNNSDTAAGLKKER